MERPPVLAAEDAAGVETVRRLISRLTPAELLERKGARFVDASELPWISGSKTGRAFLGTSGNRIIVRGKPADRCPVAFAEGAPRTTPLENLARTALMDCLGRVAPGCGCEVVAFNSALTVAREDISYATGIAARLRARSLGIDSFLVAEELPDGGVLLRDLSKTIGTVRISDAKTASVKLTGIEGEFSGSVRDVGFRRGRKAQRIYAVNAQGERLSLLIGFDPDELAEFAGAWLAWPPDA
ncbi:MAG: hypothetical protein AAGD13_10295 [Pseudomonadota bacterium]